MRNAYGDAGLGGQRKRRPGCNGLDTGLNVTRCESRQTSDWSFFVRELGEWIEWEKANDSDSIDWCTLIAATSRVVV